MAYRDYSVANSFIVDPNGFGDFTTIGAALTAASSGNTIFIRPGTYTENLTLKSGVNLTAFNCDAITPNVTIIGKLTATFAGTASISGIKLQTNSDFCVSVTGSAATILGFYACFLDANNNNAVQLSSSSGASQISFYAGKGNIETTGIAYFSHSGAGQIRFIGGIYENGGVSSTASTVSGSGGVVGIRNCYWNNAITTTGTGFFIINNCELHGPFIANSTAVAGDHSIANSGIDGGSSSALSIGAGATVTLATCVISSTNTNAITGAGTLLYADLSNNNTSNLINTTTQTANYTQLGKWRAGGQPCFYAYLAADKTAVVGNSSSAYQVPWDTLAFDQNSNFTTGASALFTAPVAGRYYFTCCLRLKALTAAMTYGDIRLSATGVTLLGAEANVGAGQTIAGTAGQYGLVGSWLINMAAGDTASIGLIVQGGASAAAGVVGAQTGGSYFQGYLVA